MKIIKITIATVIILLFTINILLINGKYNWEIAKEEAINTTQLTDLDICNTNLKYGFRLKWYETPTSIDFILSNFRSYKPIEIITIYSAMNIYYLTNNTLLSENGNVSLISNNRKMLLDSLETLTANDANKTNGY